MALPVEIDDGIRLASVLPGIVEDFNNRPHVSLDGLSPNEAESGVRLDKIQLTNYKLEATHQRKAYNRVHRCRHCS